MEVYESNCVIVRVTKFSGGSPGPLIDQEVFTGDSAPMDAVKSVQSTLSGNIPDLWDSGFYRLKIMQGYQGKHSLIEGEEIARWDVEIEKKISVRVLSFEGTDGNYN